MFASGECFFCPNLNPLCKPCDVSYILIPTMCYYQFLLVNRSNDMEKQELVDLVVTTYTALYRYKTGDVLIVTGFMNNAPQVKFICKKDVVLCLEADKIEKFELHNAVRTPAISLGLYNADVADYTSYVDTRTIPGHYVLYWELKPKGLSTTISTINAYVYENCCYTIKMSLNSVYRHSRSKDKSIGPLEIKIVRPGTFGKLMDYEVISGTSINGYETPRSVKSTVVLKFLESMVVKKHFAREDPNLN